MPGGGLAAHEGTATYRGHTLLKHVGKTPEQLAQRFAEEPALRWSSSFTDRHTAEAAVAKVLEDHRLSIARWLAGSPKPYLLLRSDTGVDVGTSVARDGSMKTTSVTQAVLRKENSVLGYYIQTAYPKP